MQKNKFLKTILSIGTILVMSVAMTGCGQKTTNVADNNGNQTANAEKLVVGFDDTFVPMGFKDDKGQVTGFDVELAKEVANKIGKEVEFQPIDWSMKESELNNENIDVIWNGYSVTEERKQKVDFSNVYLKNKQVIITLKDSEIQTKADLAGKKVGAQNQSSSVDAVQAEAGAEESFDGGQLLTYETNNDALMDLESGRLEAVVADEILARYYINKRGEDKYKILEDNFGDEDYAIGVKQGNTALLDAINKGLKECNEDGTSAKISTKWFGEDIVVK